MSGFNDPAFFDRYAHEYDEAPVLDPSPVPGELSVLPACRETSGPQPIGPPA